MRFAKSLYTAFILILLILTLPSLFQGVSTAFGQEQNQQENTGSAQNNGDIWEYRDNYVPVQYFPIPEFMVFVDTGVLILLMATGLIFVLRKKPARWLSYLAIIALVYLGIIRGGCICPVGSITNITMGILNPQMIGLVTMVIFLSPVIFALVAGRIFCTSGCPIGAVQHLFYSKKRHIRIPSRINTILKIIPVLILAATVYAAIYAKYYLVCELEPYKAIFFLGKTWSGQLLSFITGQSVEAKLLWAMGIFSWIYLVAILIAGFWIPRPFCRFLCPYGVLLGFISMFSFKRRKINNETCIHCGMCQKVCPTQAIVVDRKNKSVSLSNYDCVQCNLCSDSCKKGAIK
jgi:polyferredoxin